MSVPNDADNRNRAKDLGHLGSDLERRLIMGLPSLQDSVYREYVLRLGLEASRQAQAISLLCEAETPTFVTQMQQLARGILEILLKVLWLTDPDIDESDLIHRAYRIVHTRVEKIKELVKEVSQLELYLDPKASDSLTSLINERKLLQKQLNEYDRSRSLKQIPDNRCLLKQLNMKEHLFYSNYRLLSMEVHSLGRGTILKVIGPELLPLHHHLDHSLLNSLQLTYFALELIDREVRRALRLGESTY